jgi:hypothetical protein
MQKKIFATALLGGIAALAAATSHAQAAQPQFLITWSASKTSAPTSYSGKLLPNASSQISASLELLSAQGKPLNIAGQTIYWYLNENILGGGIGMQRTTFTTSGDAPNVVTLRVTIPDYPGGMLIHEIQIPIVQPVIIIDAPFANNTVSTNPVVVQAIPYFFNASTSASLAFHWSVNGQAVTDATNPQSLQITLPGTPAPGLPIAISLTATNAVDSMSAHANSTLTYQPHL